MISRDILITNKSGFHARPAAQFVQTVNRYRSNVVISKNDKEVNGRSLISILSLSIAKDSNITIYVDGEDEIETMDNLVKLIETKFGEE